MIQINYPTDQEKTAFEKEYFEMFSEFETKFTDKLDKDASNIIKDFYEGYCYKTIITGNIKELKKLYCKYRGLNDLDKAKIQTATSEFFTYKQEKISRFFKSHNQILEMGACYYCNIDSVHVYSDYGEYLNSVDFLNRATKKELIDLISDVEADDTIAARNSTKLTIVEPTECARMAYNILDKIPLPNGYNSILHFLRDASDSELRKIKGIGNGNKIRPGIIAERTPPNKIDFGTIYENPKVLAIYKKLEGKGRQVRDHYTLDHYIPQNECFFLARSLYNFVPSCYVCNSKLKKIELLCSSANADDLHKFSPTYEEYKSTGDITFSLLIKKSVNVFDYDKKTNDRDFLSNFKIEVNAKDPTNKAVDLFKLQQRYAIYKNKAIRLAYLQEKYSDKTIEEIANILSKKKDNKIVESGIKKAIFDIPETSNESFSKLLNDIDKQLKQGETKEYM